MFKQNEGAGFNFVQNQQDWIRNGRKSVEEMRRLQSAIYANELAKSRVVNAVKSAVSALAPKSLGLHLLKLKIHMQTLIGNTFGIKFRGLEESKKRYNDAQQSQNPQVPPKRQNSTSSMTSSDHVEVEVSSTQQDQVMTPINASTEEKKDTFDIIDSSRAQRLEEVLNNNKT